MKISMLEGYGMAKSRKKRRSKSRKGGSQRAKFSRAAKACKGRSAAQFRACMRKKLKK